MSGGRWGPDWELALGAMGWRCWVERLGDEGRLRMLTSKRGELACLELDEPFWQRGGDMLLRRQHEGWRQLWEQALLAEGMWAEQERERREEQEQITWAAEMTVSRT